MYKSAVFAPLPPPVGGVASITQMLKDNFESSGLVLFEQPVAKTSNKKFRAIRSYKRLLHTIRKVKLGGRIFIFASQGMSFYEKIVWSVIIFAFKRKAYILLVDGNFPSFWSHQNRMLKHVIRWVLSATRTTLCAQSYQWLKYYSGEFPGCAVNEFPATVRHEFQNKQKESARDHQMQKKKQLLYVGWIIKEKGIGDLLDAIQEIQSNDFVLNIAGPNIDSQLMERVKCSDQVQYHGCILEPLELKILFSKADIFVFPSWAEGLPVSLIEAVSQRLACVATDIGGIPDIVKDKINGILIDAHNPGAMAKALTELIESPDQLRLMSEQSGIIFESKFSLVSFRKKFSNLLGIAG